MWDPKPVWKGLDVFIIGGGTSLDGFNFQLLKNKRVIGCNLACTLGSEIVDICVFGDEDFSERYADELLAFGGIVCTPALRVKKDYPWIRRLRREPAGLHTEAVGWNGNTGAVAINLALLLGAARVFLLGFDMYQKGGESNWHREYNSKPQVYDKFKEAFVKIVADWQSKFSDRQIINLNPDSGLEGFPKAPAEEFVNE